MSEDLPGELSERFEVRRVLGAGGFGRVLLARDRELDRPVAIKLLHEALEDAQLRARFEREARVTSSLVHPHVVQVFDFGFVEESIPYIVYEYVEGRALGTVSGELDPAGRVRVAAQVARALHAAHRAGVVHRDVKPGNVLLRESGDAVLCDFGIARRDQGSTVVTAEGLILGTPAYMAPELWKGVEPSPASDQFACAAMLFRLLTGESVFGADEPGEIVKRLAGWEPVTTDRGPPGIGKMLQRALSPLPDRRFSDCRAFAEALEAPPRAAATVVLAREPPAPSPGEGRARLLLPAGAAVFLLVAGGVLLRPERAPVGPVPPPTEARVEAAREAERDLEQAYRKLTAPLLARVGAPEKLVGKESLEVLVPEYLHPTFDLRWRRFLKTLEPWWVTRGPLPPGELERRELRSTETMLVTILDSLAEARRIAGSGGLSARHFEAELEDPFVERYQVLAEQAATSLKRLLDLEPPLPRENRRRLLLALGGTLSEDYPDTVDRYVEEVAARRQDYLSLEEVRTVLWSLDRAGLNRLVPCDRRLAIHQRALELALRPPEGEEPLLVNRRLVTLVETVERVSQSWEECGPQGPVRLPAPVRAALEAIERLQGDPRYRPTPGDLNWARWNLLQTRLRTSDGKGFAREIRSLVGPLLERFEERERAGQLAAIPRGLPANRRGLAEALVRLRTRLAVPEGAAFDRLSATVATRRTFARDLAAGRVVPLIAELLEVWGPSPVGEEFSRVLEALEAILDLVRNFTRDLDTPLPIEYDLERRDRAFRADLAAACAELQRVVSKRLDSWLDRADLVLDAALAAVRLSYLFAYPGRARAFARCRRLLEPTLPRTRELGRLSRFLNALLHSRSFPQPTCSQRAEALRTALAALPALERRTEPGGLVVRARWLELFQLEVTSCPGDFGPDDLPGVRAMVRGLVAGLPDSEPGEREIIRNTMLRGLLALARSDLETLGPGRDALRPDLERILELLAD